MKPRASKCWWPPVKVYNLFNTVIGLSHLCCHVLSEQPFSKFPYTVALHFKILQNFKHHSSSSPLLNLIRRGVARISEKYRHKLFRRGVCVGLKVGGTKGGTP